MKLASDPRPLSPAIGPRPSGAAFRFGARLRFSAEDEEGSRILGYLKLVSMFCNLQFIEYSTYILLSNMPRPNKRNLQLHHLVESILPMEPEEVSSGFTDHEEENNSQWEVDERGDSDVSSNSDDEPKV